jgi:TolB protein
MGPFANAKLEAGDVINDLSYKVFKPLRIAVPDFLAENSADEETARDMTRVITENLRRSGQFALINPAYFEKFIQGSDVLPSFVDWRAINVPALVTGRISRESNGRFKTEFRLWNVFGGALLREQRYFTTPDNFRRIAHIISDAIYQPLTGERGYFDSRVVFVEETGPKDRRVERLALMDQDGANLRYLTGGEDSIATPHFSPSTREIVYTSFGQGDPRVYLLNIETDQRETVGDFPGLTFSPRFSPDGRRVVMSLHQDGKSNLFAMDLRSKVMTRLTDTPGTAPSYSPFGNQICFEADNGGKPEIHAMAAGGGPAYRIGSGRGFHSAPVWSPRGHTIAFTTLGPGANSAIGIIRPDGGGERILTKGYHNDQGPSFAPNGQVLMFERYPGGSAGPALFTIDLVSGNEVWVPTPSFARDPAWSPLLPLS